MKHVFVVINRSVGSVIVYDASAVSVEELLERFPYNEYYVEHKPLWTDVQ